MTARSRASSRGKSIHMTANVCAAVWHQYCLRMDVEEAICLWILYRRLRRRRRRQRRYWVHPILSERLSSSLYNTLYPDLRLHEEKFFNYFRMSVASFDFLYDCVENDLKPSEDAIRYCISPKEKLIVTLR